ncbi:MAG TPA: alkaline phosphatase family protein [Mycobacteriales bacterium]|nr:alkaline phosphatase family protein [Mycobacteriales bacterium]
MSVTVDVAMRERAVAVLCDPALAHVVDLVAWQDGDAVYVANSAGAARLTAGGAEVLHGRDPVGSQDPLAFTPLTAELADPSPSNASNTYPFAFARLAGLFAADAAPDLAVVHTGSHHWPERGGHLGEHGSLGVVQSRAPLLLSGAGVTARGMLPLSARVVDIAPTLAWLAGVPLSSLSGMDGAALLDVLAPGENRHVVGLLWDGCNSNSLYALARSGELPNVARLLEQGCAFVGGSIAEFPSVTLVNHTSALTGVGPGRHGIVNNAYFDRRTAAQVLTNDAATWHRWSEWLAPGVRTVFERVDGSTASVNEPVDTGADYSTFALVRAGGSSDGAKSMNSLLPDPHADAQATQEHVRADADYAWSSSVDAIGLEQVLSLWPSAAEAPRLMWWNTLLTDTGHHAGGPHSTIAHDSMRDADKRLGVFLDHLERIGALSSTTIVLTSDHGSEGADPSCVGDWDEPLREAGVRFRDEAYGFIYLGHS